MVLGMTMRRLASLTAALVRSGRHIVLQRRRRTRRTLAIVTLALLALLLDVPASSRFADLQRTLAQASNGDAHVRAFVDRAGGTPLVDGNTATFLVESDDPTAAPRLLGDWTTSDEGDALTRLGSTRFFFRTVELPRSARLEYLLRLGQREVPDPLNRRRTAGFAGSVFSEVRMPGTRPWSRRRTTRTSRADG